MNRSVRYISALFLAAAASLASAAQPDPATAGETATASPRAAAATHAAAVSNELRRRPVAPATGQGAQLASAVTPSSAAAPAGSVALNIVEIKDAKPAKPAADTDKPAEPTAEVELWLGERIGRFGDYEFAILGGRPDYPTPTGAFQIEWKSRSWWSKQWDAEMQYACFFSGGAAIHEGSLSTMSHGCVHVSMEAAKKIFSKGKEKTTRVFVYP